MPYVIRNTLILLGIMLIVLFVIVVNNNRTASQLEAAKASLQENRSSLERLHRTTPDLSREDEVISELEERRVRARESKKIILKHDDPTISYQYLLDIIETFTPDIKFNFLISRSGTLDRERVNFNTYTLNGTAEIQSLHFFLFQIEYQPPLYTIENIRLNEEGTAQSDRVNFTITLNAYYDENEGTDINEVTLRPFQYSDLKENPFYTKIHQPRFDEQEEQYLDIYAGELLGLTPSKVFFRNDKGMIVSLSEGDKVAYGNLTRIDWDNQSAIFTIDKIGIPVEETIFLEKE